MTDKEIADKVYIEPLTHDFIARIIRKEQPDALLPTLGGQTGLNMAIQLHESGVLQDNNVQLLGTQLTSIQQAEDREMFRTLMNDLNVPVPESDIVNTVEQAFKFKEQVGYPLIVRPAFNDWVVPEAVFVIMMKNYMKSSQMVFIIVQQRNVY